MPISNSTLSPEQSEAPRHRVLLSLGLASVIWATVGLISVFVPLVADEMYYLQWSKRLALGYFDHPPMVAYLIWLFGHHPRLAAWLLSACSIAILTKTSKDLGTPCWYYTPLLFVSTPLGLSAGLFMTPDIPLLLGWSLVIYGLLSEAPQPKWVVLGLTIGLLSKPTALLMAPAIIFRLGWLRGTQIGLVALVLSGPFLYWSATHQWLPFSFQGSRTFELGTGSFSSIFEAIGGQILLVGPLLCWGLWHLLNRRYVNTDIIFRWMCVPILAIGLCVSAGMHMEANWVMMLWVPVVIFLPTLGNRTPRFLRILHRGFGICAVVVLITLPVILDLLPKRMGPDRDGRSLEQCLRQRFPEARLLAVRYQEMALLSEAITPPHLLVTHTQRRSQYNIWAQRLMNTAQSGDVVLHLEGQCPGRETAYQQCAVSAFECLPASM